MVPTQVGILNYYIVVVQSKPKSELAIETPQMAYKTN